VTLKLAVSSRPKNVSSISMTFGMQADVDDWCMTVCSMTRAKDFQITA